MLNLSDPLADLGFVNRPVQMFNRFFAMALEPALGLLQLVPSGPHRFQRFVDVRMAFRHSGYSSSRRCRDGRSRRRFRAGRGGRKSQGKQKRCGNK